MRWDRNGRFDDRNLDDAAHQDRNRACINGDRNGRRRRYGRLLVVGLMFVGVAVAAMVTVKGMSLVMAVVRNLVHVSGVRLMGRQEVVGVPMRLRLGSMATVEYGLGVVMMMAVCQAKGSPGQVLGFRGKYAGEQQQS